MQVGIMEEEMGQPVVAVAAEHPMFVRSQEFCLPD
jgi:hypothetical protein